MESEEWQICNPKNLMIYFRDCYHLEGRTKQYIKPTKFCKKKMIITNPIFNFHFLAALTANYQVTCC